ncbi:hypothetical protein B484DRAFT_398744 [Ochromonadaceae sp. CCMP2298]|nr:hypothetical protein B484DRAFT_398744 [Ochromonadaceae sp. CCMP2298]
MIRDEIVAQTDLADAITEALKRKGVYSKMKAQLRAEVYHTLEDKTTPEVEKPQDVFLAAELIREFLIAFKLNNTLSVFCEELGQPSEMRVDREFLGGEVGLNTLGSDESIPLLLSVLRHMGASKAESQACAEQSMLGNVSVSEA